MSMNYNDPTRPATSPTDEEGILFAPVPAWERGKKRRGLGMGAAKRVAEPRTFETTDATTYRDERPVAAAVTGAPTIDTRDGFGRTTATTSTLAAEDDTAFTAPIGRTTTVRKTKSGVPGAAVAAGIVALAAIGGAGWYMNQDNDTQVAELTPGVTETSTSTTALATAPIAPPAPAATPRPMQMAAAEQARTTTTTRRVTTTRTRPAAAAPSAGEQGVNASGRADLPTGPQPYSTLQGTSAGSPTTAAPAPAVTPPVTEAPVSAEPTPVNPPAAEAAPTPATPPTEEPTAADPT